MSRAGNESSSGPKIHIRRTLLLASVFVTALVLAYIVSAPERKKAAENTNRSLTAGLLLENAVPPKRLFSWQGKVQSVKTDSITFAANVTDPGTKRTETKTFTAQLAPTTTLLGWDLSSPERADSGGTAITVEQLRPGDVMTVQSEADAEPDGSINATAVNKIITQ